jgi:arginase
MRRALGVIGVPSSAGAYAPGQEKAPQALRDAGLLAGLRAAGVEVVDHGDSGIWR